MDRLQTQLQEKENDMQAKQSKIQELKTNLKIETNAHSHVKGKFDSLRSHSDKIAKELSDLRITSGAAAIKTGEEIGYWKGQRAAVRAQLEALQTQLADRIGQRDKDPT